MGTKGKLVFVAVALAVLLAGSAYAQTTDFLDLVKSGTPRQIQTTINKGADVRARDKDGATALMLAAARNTNPEAVTALLKAGADLKAQDENGTTALMFAAWYNKKPEISKEQVARHRASR